MLVDYCRYSSKIEQIQTQTIPVPDEIVLSDIKRPSLNTCTVTLLLRYDQQYFFLNHLSNRFKLFIVQCTTGVTPQLKLLSADIPLETTSSPVDCFYSPSNNSVSIIFSNGSYRRFQLKPNPQTGSYVMQLLHSIPLIMGDSPSFVMKRRRTEVPKVFTVDWNPCLTEVNEKCFAYVSKSLSGEWTLHFVQSEYLDELSTMKLTKAPAKLVFTKNSMFIVEEHAVSVCSITVSSLTLGDILK